MAIARGAGTEIIRTLHIRYDSADQADQNLITGVQHHIYTILNINVYARTAGDGMMVWVFGYDASGGLTAQQTRIFYWYKPQLYETFSWDNKFSMNGYEPIDFTAGMDATKQDAVADQGSSAIQYLRCTKFHNNDQYDISITYVDQNNA